MVRDIREPGKRLCKRHGDKMQKTRSFTGSKYFVCPRDKCSYMENVDGEKISSPP